MKSIYLLLWLSMFVMLLSCKKDPDSLTVIQSQSFHVRQVELHFQVPGQSLQDSILKGDSLGQENTAESELNELTALKEKLVQSPDDKLWKELKQKWNDFNVNYIGNNPSLFPEGQSLKNQLSPEAAGKWARLNTDLLKFSGEVRFGDALEVLLYGNSGFTFPDTLLKSVIYTHVFDDIYVNIFGSSTTEYQHTTGGAVKLIQDTNYPKGTEMLLKIETADLRLLNIYIRIPSWAVNPKVQYGNIKYVAHPGEYCEVSKKWKKGDEITVSLKN